LGDHPKVDWEEALARDLEAAVILESFLRWRSARIRPGSAIGTVARRDRRGRRALGPGLHGGAVMADVAYVALTAVFFWLTWWLVKLCERL
jgi:hypothetical protein